MRTNGKSLSSIVHFIQAGGFVMYPLLLLSLVAIVVIVERLLAYPAVRRPRARPADGGHRALPRRPVRRGATAPARPRPARWPPVSP